MPFKWHCGFAGSGEATPDQPHHSHDLLSPSRPSLLPPLPLCLASLFESHPFWESCLHGPLFQEALPDVPSGLVCPPPHPLFPFRGSLPLLSSFTPFLSVFICSYLSPIMSLSIPFLLSLPLSLCLWISLLAVVRAPPLHSTVFLLFPFIPELSSSPCLSL